MRDDKAANDNGTHNNFRPNDSSVSNQRAQILSYLKQYGSATTLEIRNNLHILSPAPRVFELRERGVQIITTKESQSTPDGKEHFIARYILSSDFSNNTAP